jgi:hypothetical protein
MGMAAASASGGDNMGGLKNKRRRKAQNMMIVSSLLLFIAYLIVCIAVFVELEKTGASKNPDLPKGWTPIDAAYFTMASVSTVGYGDLTPGTGDNFVESKVAAVFAIVIGVIFVFPQVTAVICLITAPITRMGRKLMARAFPERGVDLDASGDVDFLQPHTPFVFYAMNLTPSVTLNVVVQLISAAIFHAIDPSNSFGLWFYHCILTATTVGYGDVNNVTEGGRLWSCFHILISVAMLGEVISTIDNLRRQRQITLERNHMFTTRLTTKMLDGLHNHVAAFRPESTKKDEEARPSGLTELEFALCMMLELGVVKAADVTPFIKQFRLLDADGNAYLEHSDILVCENKSLAEIQASAAQRRKSSDVRQATINALAASAMIASNVYQSVTSTATSNLTNSDRAAGAPSTQTSAAQADVVQSVTTADSILANTAASTLTSAAHAVSLTSANKGSPGFALRAPPPSTGFLMRQKVRASNLAGEPERATADDMHDKI